MPEIDLVPERFRSQVKTHLQTIRKGLDSFPLDEYRQPWFPLHFGTRDLRPGSDDDGSR